MSPIAPGTPCYIVQLPDSTVEDQYLGRVVTVTGHAGHCFEHACERYSVHAPWYTAGVVACCRAMLRPIGAPGLDVSEPRVELLPESGV